MSGPKVIRIVTREEIIATCERHLARLDAAFEAWTRMGRRNKVITDDDIAATEQRRDRLRRLLAQEEFLLLQNQVPDEIAFLEADMQRRLAEAVAKAASERTRRRRRVDAAKAVAAELRAKGIQAPPALAASLAKLAAADDDGADVDPVFAKAFALLVSNNVVEAVSEKTREIADRLSEGSRTASFAQWRAANLERDDDDRLTRIDTLIAELAVLDTEAARPFETRLEVIGGESTMVRKGLLIDSIIIDLAEATRVAREKDRLMAMLREQTIALGRFASDPARALVVEMNAAIAGADTSRAEALLASASTLATAETSRLAADARRSAILRGLSSLGYEVREGMATAFANGEAMVMRHANTPGFGLEMSGPPEAHRLQMRVVAFSPPGAARDSSRDRDVELQWCGNLDRLRELLAASGAEIAIERAAAAGSVALKVIDDEARAQESMIGQTELKGHLRTLQRPRT
jgi:hypothetical protein